MSHAGSPTPRQPQSMTAVILPSLARRLRASRSPWIQTGDRPHSGARRAASQAAVAAVASIVEPRAAIDARVLSSRVASGTPRNALSARPRPGSRVNALQGAHELGEVDGGRARVGDALPRCGLAFEPPVDRPRPGIAVGRNALGRGSRNRERQRGGELRQPSALDLQRADGSLVPRQAHDEVVAEPIKRVVRAARRHRLDREIGPLGKLRRDQTEHERRVRIDFVVVHLWHPHVRSVEEVAHRWPATRRRTRGRCSTRR